MKTAESDTAVLKSHAADKRTVGKESDVHGREGEQSVHHVGSCGTNPEKTT